MKTFVLKHKLLLEIILLYVLAYILVGCSKAPSPSATDQAAAQERVQIEIQKIEAVQKQYQQRMALPDPTRVKVMK